MPEAEGTAKPQRNVGLRKIVILVLCVIIIVLIITFVIAVVLLHDRLFTIQEGCAKSCPSRDSNINLEDPDILPPFYDLTKDELMSVKKFLYAERDLNLVHSGDILCNRSFVFTIELYLPDKDEVLNFLDNDGTIPTREASAVIFRGDKSEPIVQEFIVGPLPKPTYKRSEKQLPFIYRPLSTPEFSGAVDMVRNELQNKVSNILEESYGGYLYNCTDRCLDFQMITPMSTELTGEPLTRKMWFWLAPVVEYWSLHPLNFMVLVDVTSTDVKKFMIDKIYYGYQLFNTVDELKEAYETGSVIKTKMSFPSVGKNLYSSVNRRGTLFPEEPLLPPKEFEPMGKRYSIYGRHITYMGWDFDVRMSAASGPQIFDIRYNNERIVYELSLQEIAVFYSADSPAQRFADYLDGLVLIGSRARSLVSGADCPEHSTYLSTDFILAYSEEPVHLDRAFCVFEHNTGVPLRRHLTFQGYNMFYEGMMDIVLTVRTITTITNYDYILDFIFHQNGALEVKVVSTGYILTSLNFPAEDDYGFRLRDQMTANIHHHMFHFKADMDIHGKQNRFETIEIVPVQVDNKLRSVHNKAKYSQTRMVRRQLKSEKEAALKYDFEKPNYLTFYNNKFLAAASVPRAYRLLTRGISKKMVEEGTGQEPSVSWARYQVAVTKYKEEERRSSSMYATWDVANPVVDFQTFIDDDENIKDEDQVTWITMGIHHIPHMEDIPITPTVGHDLGFFLLPYNYFDEDPAIGSGDAIRIEPRDQLDLQKGLIVETYGKSEQVQCLPKQSTFISDVKKNPHSIFDHKKDEFELF